MIIDVEPTPYSPRMRMCIQCANAITLALEIRTGVYTSSMTEKFGGANWETDKKTPAWLTWGIGKAGLTSLRSVSLNRRHARSARNAVEFEPRAVRAWIEETVTNHLFGARFLGSG